MSTEKFNELTSCLRELEAAIIRAADNAEARMANEGHRDIGGGSSGIDRRPGI